MKIWIDLTNSPHVNFFAEMIRELEKKDHEVVLTCRPLANTIDLLDLEGLKYSIVGSHYGARKIKKILGFPIRIVQLYKFLRSEEIDVAISHSSFYSPVVARLLGIPSVYLNDNEHAAGNRISFLCATKVMVPEFMKLEEIMAQGARKDKILQYPGVKEGVYLWNYAAIRSGVADCFPRNGRKNVVIRPEPWTAQYYSGRKNFLDELLMDLLDRFNVLLLPRGREQREHYKQTIFVNLIIPKKSLSLKELMEGCDLFIGAGGTMTREAAVLGIPTISVYQDKPLEVDKYLITCGYMIHEKNPSIDFIVSFMNSQKRQAPRTGLLKKGKDAYVFILETLLSLGQKRTGEKLC